MQLNPTEISNLIKQKIQNFEATSEARTEGTIVSLTDGIVRIHGLQDVMYGEMTMSAALCICSRSTGVCSSPATSRSCLSGIVPRPSRAASPRS